MTVLGALFISNYLTYFDHLVLEDLNIYVLALLYLTTLYISSYAVFSSVNRGNPYQLGL